MSSEMLPIIMECRINEETNIKIYEDEPLIISVSMVNDEAIQAASYNTSLEFERQELEKKLNENLVKEEEFKIAVEEIEQRKLKFRSFRFGGPMGWIHFVQFRVHSKEGWRNLNWPLKLLTYDPASQIAELDASTSCYVEFGLDPHDSTQVAREEFKLKAIVEIVRDNPVESNGVTVNFLSEKLPKAIKNSEEKLLDVGRYFYKRSLFEEAKKYVENALQVNQNSIRALILLGNIEEKRGNYAQALEAYKKAEQKFYAQEKKERYEPPEYIISKIITLQNLLKE